MRAEWKQQQFNSRKKIRKLLRQKNKKLLHFLFSIYPLFTTISSGNVNTCFSEPSIGSPSAFPFPPHNTKDESAMETAGVQFSEKRRKLLPQKRGPPKKRGGGGV